jgi:hypothetical protein
MTVWLECTFPELSLIMFPLFAFFASVEFLLLNPTTVGRIMVGNQVYVQARDEGVHLVYISQGSIILY